MSKFRRDLEVGKVGENIAKKALEFAGYLVTHGDGRKADLLVEGLICEIKYDIYANRSNNIAIEFFNSKTCKPSGLGSTSADLWIHVLSDTEVYICDVQDLKGFTEKIKPKRTIFSGGDKNADMWLYSKEDIISGCFLNLTKEVVDELIAKISSRKTYNAKHMDSN